MSRSWIDLISWTRLEGYDNVYRCFERVMDRDTPIRKLVGEKVYDGELVVSRYIDTIYDVSNTRKLGVRIESIRMPLGVYDDDWLDGLFVEGKPLEVVLRSAMKHSRRAQRSNILTRGKSSSGPASNGVVSSTDVLASIAKLMGE